MYDTRELPPLLDLIDTIGQLQLPYGLPETAHEALPMSDASRPYGPAYGPQDQRR